MKTRTLSLYDKENKFRKGQIVAISTKWALFEIGDSKRKDTKKLKFYGITHEKIPCSCDYCCTGGVSGGIPQSVNRELTCDLAKLVKKMEKETP